MSIRIVRLGSPRLKGEGLRIGTVRRPPRGVPKGEFASRDFYDSVGCDCEDEAHCHRSILRELLVAAGAKVVG